MKQTNIDIAGLENKTAEEVIHIVCEAYGQKNIVLASSFSAEDQVLTHMLQTQYPELPVLTLDTGRLPQETYDVMAETMKKYNMRYTVLSPQAKDIEDMVSQHGPNLFYDSVENRKKCCYVRKVKPLADMLKTYQVWFTGIRNAQSITRTNMACMGRDTAFGLWKASPLLHWSEKDVWNYIHQHAIPYNALHDKGYPSIGCAPCTQAVKQGEDIRAGRWWWENPDQKECGLHDKDGKITREQK